MKSISIVAATGLLAVVPAFASQTTAKGIEEPSAKPTLNVAVVQGCFSSPGELEFWGTIEFNSKDECGVKACKAKLNKPVAATMGGNMCYCGDKYPPKAALVNDSNCNTGCSGYDFDACTYSVMVSFMVSLLL
jgi:cell wall integrity and stress response component